jgi:hypothetical protein
LIEIGVGSTPVKSLPSKQQAKNWTKQMVRRRTT